MAAQVLAGLAALALLVAGAPQPYGDPAETGTPDACEVSPALIRCTQTFPSDGVATTPTWDMPVFDGAFVTVMVALSGARPGADGGWSYTLGDGNETTYSQASHYPSNDPVDAGRAVVEQVDTHLLPRGTAETMHVAFVTGARQVEVPGTTPPGSSGTFTVTVVSERIPEGVAPVRPAATRADPHLAGAPGGPRPEMDLLAAWLDDVRLDDGLMEAHVAVRDLTGLEEALTPSTGVSRPVASWYLQFTVRTEPLFVRWFAKMEDDALVHGCELRRGVFDPDARQGPETAQGSTLLVNPLCAFDASTGEMHATFPERSLANPAPGERFTDLRTDAVTWEESDQAPFPANLESWDRIANARYDFALGGPAVWSVLNARLDPPPVPPWYAAPLHEENLPDTLQVVGALVATATFLIGALVVFVRRRRLVRLLEEVDRVSEKYENDARRALLALGELDARYTKAFRAGKLHEAPYQVVTQRIAASATRFALRRELGLDDGTPGDSPLGARRIPVQVAPDERPVR